VAVITWASSFPIIRLALDAYTPLQLAFLRYALVSVVLLLYTRARRWALPPLRDSLRIALLGVVGIAAYNVLLFYGQRHVPAGTASLLIASTPVWMVVLAALFSGERPPLAGMASVAVSFSGTAVIAVVGHDGGAIDLGGYALAIVGAALVGAIYSVFLRPYTARYGALRVTAIAAWGATLALSPGAVGLAGALRAAPPLATGGIVWLALLPGVIGYSAWAYASARATAVASGVALYLVPVLAMLFSNWLLGEVPSAASLLGGALVLAGVIGAQRFRSAPPRPTALPARVALGLRSDAR